MAFEEPYKKIPSLTLVPSDDRGEFPMSLPPFDPSNAVTFDLAHGLVHLEDAPSRVLVPSDALIALAKVAGKEAAGAFAMALGSPLGQRAARRLSPAGGIRGATVDVVVDHLGGELALAGLGSLSLERWGRALIFVVDQSPLATDDGVLLGGVLSSALEAATGRDAWMVLLMKDDMRQRYLLANSVAADKARGWLGEGASWGDVLARLHNTEEKR